MLTAEQLKNLNIGIDTEDTIACLQAEAALEWIGNNTTIDITDLDNLPAGAKLFISKFCELNNLHSGVSSESIGGLSQSFTSENKAYLIWDLATTLLSSYIKSQIQFIPEQKRWI